MADTRMLSVIVPVYNVDRKYLAECFESILEQTFTDFELIVIDDGAGEDLAGYMDDFDFRTADVKIIHQANTGVAGARNRGLEACRGKYVTFVDSDDTIEKDCFEGIIKYAEENSLEVLTPFSPYVCDIGHFSEKQREEVRFKCLVGILPFYECPPASADAAGSACAKLYRRDFLNENSLRYRDGLQRAEDMEFNFRVLDRAEDIGFLHRFYYIYRQIATSATYVYRDEGIEVFTASLNAIHDYLLSAGKTDLYFQVYYMRCMFFFLESMDMDYLNPGNTAPLGERLKKLAAKSEEMPYSEAFANLRGDHLTVARKIPLFLIRHRMFRLLALFYSVYHKVQGI